MKLKAFLLLLSIAPTSYAQESVMSSSYSFGGACASQGAWTQTALSATQNLRKITHQLKDDPNCKALGASLESSFQNLETTAKTAADTPSRINRMSLIQREIDALRALSASNPEMKDSVSRLIMDRSIEGATLSAQVGKDLGNLSTLPGGSLDFGARMQQSTKTGINILNQVVDSIPKLDQCLIADDQRLMGSIIGSAVQLASSFAASGQDPTGSQLALTASKLANLGIDRKFSKVLRKLNQQEFMASMACLMEVTSESYCQARIGMNLFKKGMEDLKTQRNGQLDVYSGSPFVGYYVLNTHVPNITKWLQQIQIGVDPKLPSDAIAQNKIQQEVTDFYKSVKTLLGTYNSELITIKSQTDPTTQQNSVLQLLIKITNSMISKGDSYGPASENKNFFTMSRNSVDIPFELVGMPVPDQVSGKTFPQQSYDKWFQFNINGDAKDLFKDPVALAEKIGQNMQLIIRDTNLAAIEYFNKWYIVDKAALVNQSAIDINYTVPESLTAIYKYLEIQKEHIKKYNGEASTVPTIIDTQIRIKKILAVYNEIETLGKKVLYNPESMSTEAGVLAVAETYEKLVNTVYEQFNVMQSRSGFLANRMVNFVYQDYILLLKSKVDFTPYQQDLFTATGMAALDKMLQMYNGNPANIQSDLNMALRINKGNIEALEGLLLSTDAIPRVINELDYSIKGGGSLWKLNFNRAAIDNIKGNRKDSKWFKITPWSYSLYKLLFLPFNTVAHAIRNPGQYPMSLSSTNIVSPQSEFGEADAVKAQLCIQALAFNNTEEVDSLCRGTVLKSPFGDGDSTLNVSYDKTLNAYRNDQKLNALEKKEWNHSERICAFRDYNMRNMAKFMSLNKPKH